MILISIIGALAMLAGYFLFLGALKLFLNLERKDHSIQKDKITSEANKQIEMIKEESRRKDEEKEILDQEEVELSLREGVELLEEEEQALTSKESLVTNEEQKVEKIEKKLEARVNDINSLNQSLQNLHTKSKQLQITLITTLETTAQQQSQLLVKSIADQRVDIRQLECQKMSRFLLEEISSSGRKKAQQALDRALNRYQPTFIWPKPINHIDLEPKMVEIFSEKNEALIEQLKELSGVNIQLKIASADHKPTSAGVIRVAGGFGIDREAVRVAISESMKSHRISFETIRDYFKTHQRIFEKEAVDLGKKAVNQLKIKGIHPEIQRLVGALNWRTSYRQNQWYHTVEVATLAGVIAKELGVDPDDAKRVGLLHDIGKAIDYRIEGSHAVISGDYADRFGERRVICDVVMSHHADLLVESPLAYVLRAADTLSGARPGARVNLEEGYQVRIGAIYDVVNSFRGITDVAVMNGGREVHIQVDCDKIKDSDIQAITEKIKAKITEDVSFPGQIKILVTRIFESTSVA